MNSQDPSQFSMPPTNASAPDPLVELQDIHLPAEIGLWPPAWGWWLLLLVVIVSVASLVFFIKRHKSRNAYRALAIAELNTSFKQYSDEQNSEYLQALSVILRRTALSGFGHQFNASLKGHDFLQWLDEQCAKTNSQFSKGVGTALLIGPYQKNPEFDRMALHQLSFLWIKEHRNQWQCTKKSKKNQKNSEAEHHV
jgi:Domain of unknown function (DUF4381)